MNTRTGRSRTGTRWPATIGPLLLTGTGRGPDGGVLPGRPAAGATAGALGEAARAPFAEAGRQLEEYFSGERQVFDLPLAPAGTPFQLAVWRALQGIGYGQTTSYGQLARELGHAHGARAVGLANGSNPLPVIIPCHRVIGADGSLTGFGGGLRIKRALLHLEGAACVTDLFSMRVSAAGPCAAGRASDG